MSDRPVEYRVPVPQSAIREGRGKAVRKTASSRTLRYSDSSEDEDKGGGARLDASPPNFTPRPASAMGSSRSSTMSAPEISAHVETLSSETLDHGPAGGYDASRAETFQDAKGKQRTTHSWSDDEAEIVDSDSTLTPAGSAALPEPVQTDPQSVFPARACLFVANLPHAADDATLIAELHRGLTLIDGQKVQVFLKVRRDSKNMPFAFAQYTTEEDANTAMLYKQRYLVCGRAIRIERLKGNSEFIIHRKKGEEITFEQASNVMLQHGRISSVEPLPLSLCQVFNVPNAFVVKYKYFDEKRNVRASFSGNEKFKVRVYDEDDPTKDVTGSHTLSEDERYLIDQEYQGRSVFFGSLPKTFAEHDLHHLARTVGNVRSVEYHVLQAKPVGRGTGYFGFVEYSSIQEVKDAVAKLNNKEIDGVQIRVHPRRTGSRGQPQFEKVARPEEARERMVPATKPAPPPTAPTSPGSGEGITKHKSIHGATTHRSNKSSGSSSAGTSYSKYASSPESMGKYHDHEERPRPQLRRRPALSPINTVAESSSATLASASGLGALVTDTKRKRGSVSTKSGSSASPRKSCFPASGKKTPSPQKEVTFASPETISPMSDSSSDSDHDNQAAGIPVQEKSPFDTTVKAHPLLSGNADAAAGYLAAQQMYGTLGCASGTSGPSQPPATPSALALTPPPPSYDPPPPPPFPPATTTPPGLPIPGVPSGQNAIHSVAYVPCLAKWLPVIIPKASPYSHQHPIPPPPGRTVDAYHEYRYPRGPPPLLPYSLSLPEAGEKGGKPQGYSSRGSNAGSPTKQ